MKGKKIMDKNQEETKSSKTLTTEKLDTLINEDNRLIKRLDSETVGIKNKSYKIKENYREALDLELLEERYSDLLDKYDFIVGDMSYGKLRLRGFYEDSNRKAPIDMRISSLEDYLLEYCSFGCAYFVLENLDSKKRSKNKAKTQSDPKKKQTQANKRPNPKKNTGSKQKNQKKEEKRTFTKKNRSEAKADSSKNEKVKDVKNKKGSTRFQIRKKKD